MGALKENRWLIVSLFLLPVLLLALFMIFIMQDSSQEKRNTSAGQEERLTTVENFDNFSDIPEVNVTPGESGKFTKSSPSPPLLTETETNSEREETANRSTPQETTSSSSENKPPALVPPEAPQIIKKPAKTSNSKMVFFKVRGNDNIYCSLNKSDSKSCSGKVVYKNLQEGAYLFQAWQENEAGRSEIVSYPFTIDRTPPRPVRLTSTPKALSKTSTATFSFQGEKEGKYICKLTGRGKDTCLSPKKYQGLADGKYQFYVWQKDQAGNKSKIKSFVFQIDTEAPQAPMINSSEISGNNLIVFFKDDGYDIFCAIDSAAFVFCPVNSVFTDLAPGSHILSFYQEDAAGNRSSLSKYDFTIQEQVILSNSHSKRFSQIEKSGAFSIKQEQSRAYSSEPTTANASVSVESAIELDIDRKDLSNEILADGVGETRGLKDLERERDTLPIGFDQAVLVRSNATFNITLSDISLEYSGSSQRAGELTMSGDSEPGLANQNNLYQLKSVQGTGAVDWSDDAGSYSGTAEVTATNNY